MIATNRAQITTVNREVGGWVFTLPPIRIWNGNDLFQSPGEFAPRQQDPPLAGAALQPNVGAEADDFPIVTAAWMRLPQADDGFQAKFWKHGRHYNMGWYNRHTGPGYAE